MKIESDISKAKECDIRSFFIEFMIKKAACDAAKDTASPSPAGSTEKLSAGQDRKCQNSLFPASRSSVSKALTGSHAAGAKNVAELVHPIRTTSGGAGRKGSETVDLRGSGESALTRADPAAS